MNIFDIRISNGIEIPNTLSLSIYFSGCNDNKKCDRNLCNSKDLYDFDNGFVHTHYYEQIQVLIEKTNIDAICLTGGEPFDQDIQDMKEFISYIRSIKRTIKIYACTGYTYKEDKATIDKYMNELQIDDVCYGSYSPSFNNKKWLRKSF